MFKAKTFAPQHLQPKTVAMKRLTLLFVLLTALGHGGQNAVLSNQATVAAPTEKLDARSLYEPKADPRKINLLDKKLHNNETRLLAAGSANEGEAKRLRLIFLIMMSLGQYRTPAH